MLSWLLIEVIKNGKPTLVGASTGLVIGLVAITPGAGFVPIWAGYFHRRAREPHLLFLHQRHQAEIRYDDALDSSAPRHRRHRAASRPACSPGRPSIRRRPGRPRSRGRPVFLRQLAAIGIRLRWLWRFAHRGGIASLVTKGLKVTGKSEDIGHRQGRARRDGLSCVQTYGLSLRRS
jgi:Amt family ammonium transporter